jgi:MFS family permease
MFLRRLARRHKAGEDAPGMKHTPPENLAARPSLLASRDFLLLWAVGGVGNAMRWLEVLAAALFTLDVTGSELAVAAVSAARSLPLIFTGAISGVLADAFDRRAIVAGGLLLSACAAGGVALLAWAGLAQPWHLFVASLVSGLVYGTDLPARRRMTGESVAPSLAARAVALDSLTSSASRVAGPLIGGVAYEWLGLAGTFAGSALLSLCAAGLTMLVRHSQHRRSLAPAAVAADLAEAVAVVRRAYVLLTLILVTVAQNLFGFAYTSLVAPAGRDVFGVSAAMVGVLAAAEPAGATLGGLALAVIGTPPGQPIWLLLGGSAWFLGMMGLTAAAPWFWAACALLLVGGFGIALYSNEQTTIALTEAPAPVRSRVMGLTTTAIGTWPLGMLLAGWIADRIGPLDALGVLGAGGLLWLAAVGAGYARRGGRGAA